MDKLWEAGSHLQEGAGKAGGLVQYKHSHTAIPGGQAGGGMLTGRLPAMHKRSNPIQRPGGQPVAETTKQLV